eukprot:COSAG01_NODE_1644_length_9640_cov_6.926213_3_plen_274_part_01
MFNTKVMRGNLTATEKLFKTMKIVAMVADAGSRVADKFETLQGGKRSKGVPDQCDSRSNSSMGAICLVQNALVAADHFVHGPFLKAVSMVNGELTERDLNFNGVNISLAPTSKKDKNPPLVVLSGNASFGYILDLTKATATTLATKIREAGADDLAPKLKNGTKCKVSDRNETQCPCSLGPIQRQSTLDQLKALSHRAYAHLAHPWMRPTCTTTQEFYCEDEEFDNTNGYCADGTGTCRISLATQEGLLRHNNNNCNILLNIQTQKGREISNAT